MSKIKNLMRMCFLCAAFFLIFSCSIEEMVIGNLADALSSGMGTSFTGENDPELVGDALPFALKLYDSLLEKTPNHVNLLLATGSAYVMYANAWVQTPAEMLPKISFSVKQEMFKRAKKLYLRGRALVARALEIKYPGFFAQLDTQPGQILARCKKEDVPFLYWSVAGLFAAYSTDVFDLELSMSLKGAALMMQRALELDEAFNDGAIHDFFISYYAAMPKGMGGDDEKSRSHFKRAVEISGGQNPSPYVSLAAGLAVKNQDAQEYKSLLNKALAIDPDKKPSTRLAAIISQSKARWLLEHIDDFIIGGE